MFRNATMRLIAAHLVLVAVSTALVLGSLYWRVGGVIDAEQQAVVEAELRGLADDFARGGTPGARRRHRPADGRTRPTATPSTSSSTPTAAASPATSPTGRRPSPPAAAGRRSTSTAPTARARPRSPALAVSLPNGERLLVGRDVAARAAFDRTLWRALLWALAAHRRALRRHRLAPLAPRQRPDRRDRRRRPRASWPARSTAGSHCAAPATSSTSSPARSTPCSTASRPWCATSRTVTDSLAHDLRSPLGRLVRHLEAAADEEAPPEARRARIEQALREAEGVLATATALLDISRIDAGIGAEQFTRGRPRPPRRRRRRALRGGRRGARSSPSPARPPPASWCAATTSSSRSPLSNLVENALKHAPAGSTITVAAARDGGRPALVVADRGPGIPAADRDRALGRFVRLDPSRGSPGAGLGLALVAAVARMHGAEVVLGDNGPGLRADLRFPEPAAAPD